MDATVVISPVDPVDQFPSFRYDVLRVARQVRSRCINS